MHNICRKDLQLSGRFEHSGKQKTGESLYLLNKENSPVDRLFDEPIIPIELICF